MLTSLFSALLLYEAVVNKARVLWKRLASLLEGLVHRLDGLEILLLELWVQQINDLLQRLVRYDIFKGLPAKTHVLLATWTLVILRVLLEVLEDASLAE